MILKMTSLLSYGLIVLLTIIAHAAGELQCSDGVPDLPRPNINDCRYILSHLPSIRLRPDEQAHLGGLTLTLGPLRSDPFTLPTKIRHGSCWISAHAYPLGNTYSVAPLTKQSEYYSVWTEVRERAAEAIIHCLEQGLPFASHIEDIDVPLVGPIGLSVTVGSLPEHFEYTFLMGTTALRVI